MSQQGWDDYGGSVGFGYHTTVTPVNRLTGRVGVSMSRKDTYLMYHFVFLLSLPVKSCPKCQSDQYRRYLVVNAETGKYYSELPDGDSVYQFKYHCYSCGYEEGADRLLYHDGENPDQKWDQKWRDGGYDA